MVLENSNSTFCSIGSELMGWYLLKYNMMFVKCILDVLGALIVKDMEVGRVAMVGQEFV